MSRVGKKPIQIPKDVKVNINESTITVEGPRGKLSYELRPDIKVEIKDEQILVMRNSNVKEAMTLHGLTRSLINNMVIGVTLGYQKELEIVGVGFRAQVSEKKLVLQLGLSHPVEFHIPEGIVIETPKPTQIIVKGIDKQKVGEITAEIRAVYPPEPYKGKGIRYVGEYVRKKVGKAVG
ncbi:MAG: 50S ribosomal protein L6 [Omnitrophica WOR_2 bacterium SM23_29]|nr:MAG: 50S ribosomal protein L6 [Omnitrophica WOR_2 bacterium SM23_29]